jgi:hypothetical protein
MRNPEDRSSLFARAAVLAFLAWFAQAVGSGRAAAATFEVDRTDDDPSATACTSATNDCSLRGALLAASALTEASTIELPPGTYALSVPTSCTLKQKNQVVRTVDRVSLCLTNDVTISGTDPATTIIQGDGQHHVAVVGFDSAAEFRGVTLTNGLGDTLFGGGAVNNQGTLTLTDSVVSGNTLPSTSGGFSGAGLFNDNTLTLVRTTVTNNLASPNSSGGGIYNNGDNAAVLTIIDSVVSNNLIGSNGGGIASSGLATATIIGSTISGNTAVGFGGAGIYNDGSLTVTNSTISGNFSGSSGAGLTNSQHGVTELNNVTIAANTAGTAHRGQGGGIDNSLGKSLTLRNTIVAGNIDLDGTPPKPDCDARTGFSSALISQGYNLIGNATGCDITGDLTGNITGVDAKLGSLLDNGGLTPTHAPADDSPVLDAGNPAPPGSGALACAATDQRGFVRPIGSGCDIGAFERGGPFAVTKVTPSVGGDIGTVSALVSGNGFVQGASVKLTRAGQSDILGDAPRADGSAIRTSFDLTGKARGAWDVIVTNPDATTRTLPGAFTIEVGRAPDPWVDIIGMVTRHNSPFTIAYGNRGNVDAVAVPLTFGTSSAYGLGRLFPITLPPNGLLVWDEASITVTAGDPEGFTNVPLLLPVVPAGFTGTLQIRLTLPSDAATSPLIADVGTPYFAPSLDPQVVATMVQGARDYAAANLGVTIPASLVPDMTDYVTTQLNNLVGDGRDALIATIGTRPQVYSLAQLQLDVALFGGSRTLAQQSSAVPPNPFDLLAWAGRGFSRWLPLLEPSAAIAQQQNSGKCGDLLTEGGSCSSKDETINPKSTGDSQRCFALVLDYMEHPLTAPRPNCPVTEAECHTLANHHIVTLPSGAKICQPSGCDDSRDGEGAYQNTSHCRAFPIDPKKARDPNDKAGSLGVATAQFVLGDTPSSYVIHFENLDTATAPAAIVTVTDPLDVAHLDLDTFSLGPISFGADVTLVPEPGHSGFTGSVDLRPAQDIVVAVNASLDKATGILTWRFDSIDQATGQSTEDPAKGFLPPNVTPPAGEGRVSFSVKPKAGLASGTTICNQASIVFDDNPSLSTPNWCNTIDVTPPSSSVAPLASTQSATTFPVEWSGTDPEAGVSTYSVFVSQNGGPFTPFVTDSSDTSAMFTGIVGDTYAFYSIARDAVGNVEAPPATPDATTTIGAAPGSHDLAVTSISVPTKVALSAKRPSRVERISVHVQNRGVNPETIPNQAALANLVQVTLTSHGLCAAPSAALHAGKQQPKLPLTLKRKGKLAILFDATFDCANDAAKGAGHEDFDVSAHVSAAALDVVDAHAADDDCPRQVAPPGVLDPFPDGKLLDKGCGRKKPDKTFGAPVTIDVVDSRP